ncbi:MAG: hypothetical protein V7631_2526 [Massilia sp.]|jgi:hypothetical protein
MGRIMVIAAFLLAGGVAAQPQAGTVYKCVTDGKVSYGEHPCARGATTTLAVPATPTDAAVATARLARDKARLAQLEKRRNAQAVLNERERARTARSAATLRQKCERLRLKSRWADEDLQRAGREAKNAARLKAQRQAEVLAVECPA